MPTESKLYIKLGENGKPVNHPMMEENVIAVLMGENNIHYEGVDEAYILSKGYAKFERVKLSPSQYVVNQDPLTPIEYRIDPDGIVRQVFTVAELTQEQKINKWIRDPRNFELARSDWAVLPDSPLSAEKKQQWMEYRQKLRDMPAQFSNVTDPSEIIPPTKPE